jgi:hypothetical protein
MFVKSVIDNDLIPQMAALNGVVLDEEDMPFFEPAALDQIDPEQFGKLGQRLGAVGLMPLHKEFLLDFWDKCGLDVGNLKDLPEQELLEMLTAFTSRSGDGMEEGMNSGVGGANGNNSAVNSDNAV